MAVVYYADNYKTPFPARPEPFMLVREFKFTQPGVAFVINDLVKLVNIQALTGLVLDGYYIDFPDLDTGGSPAITLDLGFDGTSEENVLVAAATVGQAAGKITPAVNGVAGAIPYSMTTDKVLQLRTPAAPQTGTTAGVITGLMTYHYTGRAIVL